jgi:hypothetical protein
MMQHGASPLSASALGVMFWIGGLCDASSVTWPVVTVPYFKVSISLNLATRASDVIVTEVWHQHSGSAVSACTAAAWQCSTHMQYSPVDA